MPQALPEIQGVDNTQNWLAATRAGITDRQLQQNYDIQNQNRLMRQNVGNALASENPDMPDSQKQALQGGDFDLYGQLHGWAQKASDEEHANIAKAHEVTANLLDVIAKEPDPIKQQQYWEQAKQTAIQLGMPQDEIGKLDQMTKQFGISGALNFEAARVGKQADIIQAAQAQRAQQNKDIAQSFAALDPEDAAAHAQVLKNLAAQGNTQAAQYLTPQGELAPGARATAMGLGGLGKDVMSNQTKSDIAETKAASGGKQSALGQATENVIAGAMKRYGVERDAIPVDFAQAAAKGGGTLEFDGDHWTLRNPDGSSAAIRQQIADTMAKRYDPNVTAQNAYARKGSEANVKLDAQLNRLASVKEQIQQIRDMVGEEGSPERADMESSLGYVNNHVGKQYWGSGNVPAIMGVLGSKISTLQDELAQYVQTSGAGSDVRAKKAYDVVGDLQNSRDVPTLLKRLDGIEETIGSLKKVPRVNAASGGLNKPESDENLPTLTPEQAMKAAPGTRFKSSDGRILTRH